MKKITDPLSHCILTCLPKEQSSQNCSYDKELKTLCWELQSACVFNNGKGIESDPVKSAKIMHRIGLVHLKQKQEKISLIKCVGLLNSAIVRKPSNVPEIEKDLSKVCEHILKTANAQNPTADLIAQAKLVKSQIQLMRQKTNQALNFMKTREKFEQVNESEKQKHKINSVTKIQTKIADAYTEIMQELCQFCVDVMGPPPCRFTLVGMGSLARKEITPYSDFEHTILLEIQPNFTIHLEYFRWSSVIFHVVVLNLQEAIIPSLNVMYLNDKTCDLGDWFFDTYPNGVSFDGMMPHACKFPLGRTHATEKKPWATELIKPVDKMPEYLSSDVSLKNGYHLSDILMNTCFVYGDQTLHNEFQNGIQVHKDSKTSEKMLDEVRRGVKEDLAKFATKVRLLDTEYDTDELNVKQMFYRTSTLFIAALGKICNSKSSSSVDIIKELAAENVISDNAKQRLSYAIAIACEIRLSIYMETRSQSDYIKLREDTETDSDKFLNPNDTEKCFKKVANFILINTATVFDKILQISDVEQSSIISYFQTTYCLQREVIRLLGIKNKSYIFYNAKLLNICICCALKQNDVLVSLLQTYEKSTNEHSIKDCACSITSNVSHKASARKAVVFNCFDSCILCLEDEMNLAHNCAGKQLFEKNFELICRNLIHILEVFRKSKDLLDLFRLFEHVLNFDNYTISDATKDELNLIRYVFVGLVCVEIFKSDIFGCAKELVVLRDLLSYSTDLKLNWITCSTDGVLHFKLKNYEKSLNNLQMFLGFVMSVDFDHCEKYDILTLYCGIGSCLTKLHEYEEALTYFEIAVEMIHEYGITEDEYWNTFDLATLYHNIGKCSMKLEQHAGKAFLHLTVANKITTRQFIDLQAIEQQQQYLTSKFLHLLDIRRDLGLWYMTQNRFEAASQLLEVVFKLCELVFDSEDIDQTRTQLLTCYMGMYLQKYSHDEKLSSYLYCSSGELHLRQDQKPLNCLKTALGVSISIGFARCDKFDIFKLYLVIGSWLLELHEYGEALLYLKIADEMIRDESDLASLHGDIEKNGITLQQHENPSRPYFYAVLYRLQGLKQLNDEGSLLKLAHICRIKGLLYMMSNRLEEASKILGHTFTFHKKFSGPGEADQARIELLTCYMAIYQSERSGKCLDEVE